MARKKTALSAELRSARKHFEAWRAEREGRRRVPQDLWDLAVPLARKHGVSRASTALGVNYLSLKKQLACSSPKPKISERPELTFVEVSPLPGKAAPGAEYLVEFEDQRGQKMTVRVVDPVAVVELARSFLGNRE